MHTTRKFILRVESAIHERADMTQLGVEFTLPQVPPNDSTWHIHIGRSRSNLIVLNDLSISKTHALIAMHRGEYIYSDLKSKCGSVLNGIQVDPSVPIALRDGDALQMGRIALRFVCCSSTIVAVADACINTASGSKNRKRKHAREQPTHTHETIGESILKRMGWTTGSAIGRAVEPASKPIEVLMRRHRAGLGS